MHLKYLRKNNWTDKAICKKLYGKEKYEKPSEMITRTKAKLELGIYCKYSDKKKDNTKSGKFDDYEQEKVERIHLLRCLKKSKPKKSSISSTLTIKLPNCQQDTCGPKWNDIILAFNIKFIYMLSVSENKLSIIYS